MAHRLSSLPAVPTPHANRQPMIAPLSGPSARFARHELTISTNSLHNHSVACVVHPQRSPCAGAPIQSSKIQKIPVSLARPNSHRAARSYVEPGVQVLLHAGRVLVALFLCTYKCGVKLCYEVRPRPSLKGRILHGQSSLGMAQANSLSTARLRRLVASDRFRVVGFVRRRRMQTSTNAAEPSIGCGIASTVLYSVGIWVSCHTAIGFTRDRAVETTMGFAITGSDDLFA